MSIMRWDPFRELEDVSDRLNRLFARGGLMRSEDRSMSATGEWAPAVDIVETPEEYMVKAELPEVDREGIQVLVEQGTLRISGERKREREEHHKKFHRVERSYGAFVREFTLPEDVDDANLSADFKDGVLNVHLPKTEKTKPHTPVRVKVN